MNTFPPIEKEGWFDGQNFQRSAHSVIPVIDY